MKDMKALGGMKDIKALGGMKDMKALGGMKDIKALGGMKDMKAPRDMKALGVKDTKAVGGMKAHYGMKDMKLLFFFFFYFLQLYCPSGISPMGNSDAFPWESQLRQSRATQSTVHPGCFSVSIIHRTLTWTAESLTCAQM